MIVASKYIKSSDCKSMKKFIKCHDRYHYTYWTLFGGIGGRELFAVVLVGLGGREGGREGSVSVANRGGRGGAASNCGGLEGSGISLS